MRSHYRNENLNSVRKKASNHSSFHYERIREKEKRKEKESDSVFDSNHCLATMLMNMRCVVFAWAMLFPTLKKKKSPAVGISAFGYFGHLQ